MDILNLTKYGLSQIKGHERLFEIFCKCYVSEYDNKYRCFPIGNTGNTIMKKKYIIIMTLYTNNDDLYTSYKAPQTDTIDSYDYAVEKFKDICEQIKEQTYLESVIDYAFDGILVELFEFDQHTYDCYENDPLLKERFEPDVYSLEGYVLAVLEAQSFSKRKLIEVRIGGPGDTTKLTNVITHLHIPYTEIVFNANEVKEFKTKEELRQAVIDELSQPSNVITNKDEIKNKVIQGIP